jgi:glycosyltransferase involved in cell wall biosynthesis
MEQINSKVYWDSRFIENWESYSGPDQSRFFARLAIQHLPEWFITLIKRESLTLADWGCAQGDGTDEWVAYLDSQQLTGIDFSSVAIQQATQRYPAIRFIAENWLTEDGASHDSHDIVFSSNVIEHFHRPYDVLKALCGKARKAVILALPYREMSRHEEHFFTFLPNNIPVLLPNNFRLMWSQVVDCSKIPNTRWVGDQIILVYANQQWASKLNLSLQDCVIEQEDHASQKKQLNAELVERAGQIAALNLANVQSKCERQESHLLAQEELRQVEKMWVEKTALQVFPHVAERAELYIKLDTLQQASLILERELNANLLAVQNELRDIERGWVEENRQQQNHYEQELIKLQSRLDESQHLLLSSEREKFNQAAVHAERERALEEELGKAEATAQKWHLTASALQSKTNAILNSKFWRITEFVRKLMRWQLNSESGSSLATWAVNQKKEIVMNMQLTQAKKVEIKNVDELLGLDGESFVCASYQALLGRHPDPQGLAYYLNRLKMGSNKLSVLCQMSKSTEAKIFENKILGLDVAIKFCKWCRFPFSAWMGSLVSIRKVRVSSMEGLFKLHGEAFLSEAYALLLGRKPDSEGMKHYLSKLNAGVSKTEILEALKVSKEAKNFNAKLPKLDAIIKRYKWSRLPFMEWLKPSHERIDIKLRVIEERLFNFSYLQSNPSNLEAELFEKNAYIEEKESYIAQLLQSKNKPTAQCQFNPYDFLEKLKPINVQVIDKNYSYVDINQSFSCVTTVKNEAIGILRFLNSINDQKLKPFELIIVDGGSSDKTTDIVESFALSSSFPVKLVKAGSVNIAEGRNIGIGESKHEIILLIDAGCELTAGFISNMVGSFEDQSSVDLVSGIYHPLEENELTPHFISDWEEKNDWSDFLPSARAVAIKKSIWEKANKFPEYLSRTGEDTLFDVQYRRCSKVWVINKQACVLWDAPTTLEATNKLSYAYGYGDGESGFGDFLHHFDWVRACHREYSVALSSYQIGYLDGRIHRPVIEVEHRHIKGVILILSGVPFTDSGGGQRCSQLAMAFAKDGYKICFVNIYPSFEEKNKLFLDVDYSLFEFISLDDFIVENLIDAYSQFPKISITALMEFPHPKFIPIVQTLKMRFGRRATIIYDYIDNWRSSLGWEWYSEETEINITKVSDYLIASARTLHDDLVERTNRLVSLVPNAVNDDIFNSSLKYIRPSDLPLGNRIVMYTGALWGEWFDWDTLDFCINQLPDAEFVLIGGIDHEKSLSFKAKRVNVHFLGLKPQSELPAYLAYACVCIIPFKVDHITHFVNPLKVYEYLAMNKPVVTTPMPELDGLPCVTPASTQQEFASVLTSQLSSSHVDRQILSKFTKDNNWFARIKKLTAIVGDA